MVATDSCPPQRHSPVRYVFLICLASFLIPTHTTGAAFVELYFVLSSLFASRAYYAFGFLALTAGVVALTTATVTILFTYFVLCAEEYRYVLLSLFLSKYIY
jgi:transmembrane 9 superfamily protein 2/4